MRRRILLTGATGRTGQLILGRLLADERYSVRVLVRSEAQAARFAGRLFETVIGDVRDPATSWADVALRDVDGLISAMGGLPFTADNLWRVDYEGTQRLLAAARVAGLDHYVFISSMGVRRQRSLLHPLSLLFYPKLLAEDAIRRTGLDYTILRPGGLVDGPPQGLHNSRGEVAEACVIALERPDVRNKTFEMAAGRRSEPGADPLFGIAVDG